MRTETLFKGEVLTFHAAIVTRISIVQRSFRTEVKNAGVAAYIRMVDTTLWWSRRELRFWLEKGPNKIGNRRNLSWSASGYPMISGREAFSVEVGDRVWVRAPENRDQHSLSPVYSDKALRELMSQPCSEPDLIPHFPIVAKKRRKKGSSRSRY